MSLERNYGRGDPVIEEPVELEEECFSPNMLLQHRIEEHIRDEQALHEEIRDRDNMGESI